MKTTVQGFLKWVFYPMGHEKSVALWSADYTQTTGQSLVTMRVVRGQSQIQWREYVYCGPGWRSGASWVAVTFRLWRDMAFGRVKTLYLVCSRSNGGFLRDVPALLSAYLGVRVVVHAHGSDIVDLLANRKLSLLARALYARCEIIVPSTHLLRPLRAVTAAPIHLCENYFSGDFEEDAVNLSTDETLTVLWNSNVMASKGFFHLAEAVRQVKDGRLAVELIAVGQPRGDEEAPEPETRLRLNLLLASKWFDYRGKVAQSAAISLLREVDVVALPSRYSSECQPLALIQAMCAGKAIVASDIPALRATLQDYPAVFVPCSSVEATADALRDLCRQKCENLIVFRESRKEAAAIARKRFSSARFDRRMAAILSTLTIQP
jgi:glycosyltransferase involved in cell wall biosynthesis